MAEMIPLWVLVFWQGIEIKKPSDERAKSTIHVGLKEMPYFLPQKLPNIDDISAVVVLQIVPCDDCIS